MIIEKLRLENFEFVVGSGELSDPARIERPLFQGDQKRVVIRIVRQNLQLDVALVGDCHVLREVRRYDVNVDLILLTGTEIQSCRNE